jgi:hypothetical protein
VYLAEYNKQQICIKQISTQYEDNYKNKLIDDLTLEVEYSYNMAAQNIGPEIYDAFYVVDEPQKILSCYILMELFDSSVQKAYESKGYDDEEYSDINEQMLGLLRKQIFNNRLYCVDIKPANFVVKTITKTVNEKIVSRKNVVRMIDFGPDFCRLGTFPKSYQNLEYFYLLVVIQLLFMTSAYTQAYRIPDYVLRPFFVDPVFRRLMTHENAMNVRSVLYDTLLTSRKYGAVHLTYLTWYLGIENNMSNQRLNQIANEVVDYLLYWIDLNTDVPRRPVKVYYNRVQSKTAKKKAAKNTPKRSMKKQHV